MQPQRWGKLYELSKHSVPLHALGGTDETSECFFLQKIILVLAIILNRCLGITCLDISSSASPSWEGASYLRTHCLLTKALGFCAHFLAFWPTPTSSLVSRKAIRVNWSSVHRARVSEDCCEGKQVFKYALILECTKLPHPLRSMVLV